MSSEDEQLRELTIDDLAAVRCVGGDGEKGKTVNSKMEGGSLKAEGDEFENGVIQPPIIKGP
jgi:hypothetical protein